MRRIVESCNNSKNVKFKSKDLELFINTLDRTLPENLKAPMGNLSIGVFDNADLAKIHLDFLNDPKETDVITFDGDETGFGGEICVSAERAMQYGPKFGNTANRELCLYVAHGYLHLAGVNDIEEEDAKKMRAAEKIALEILDKNFKQPIFKFV